MSIERRRPFGPIDARRLEILEKRLPAALPDDYRAFLLEFNGAEILDCDEFDEVEGGSCLEAMFGLNVGPISEQLDRINDRSGRVAPSVFLIGSDPYGNYFGLDLVGERRGSVLFVNHEALGEPPSEMTSVAVSFTALLDRVGSAVVTRPAPASIKEALDSRDADGLRGLLTRGESASGFVHRAVATSHLDMVREVLEHGGDANERGGIGGSETPLFIAARGGRADMAALLLDHGADPNVRCSVGGTALEMAEPWPEVVEVLARAGAVPTNPRLRAAVRRILGQD